jgi:PAS domain S-box-containing protein
MSERKSMFLLIATMIMTSLIIAGTTVTILYRTAIDEERARLIETAQSQARLIESTARFNAVYSKNHPGGANSATLSQIIDAHDHDVAVGKTEFTLSKKEGENIVFLLRHRHKDHSKPAPVPFESKLAEPMRRALSGQSGSVIGLDYHGQTVLAAYEPLKELNLGIVAKMDMSDVRAPFFRAGLIVVFLTVLVVSIGAGFFIRVTNPIIRQLEKRTLELEKLNREIEERVTERTAELEEANKELELEIEERERAQRAVRESEEKYRELIKSVPAIVYKGYPDWRVEFVDPKKVEAITGHDPDKFNSGRSKWSDIIVEEDLETVRKSFIHALKTDKLFTREYRIKNVSGEIKWVHDRGHIVCNRLGEVEYISGVFYDITDRKRQEAEYQRTRELLHTAFNGVPDPLILLDDSLKVQMINKTAMRYYQLEKPEGIIGICCFDALMGKSVPCEGCQIPAAIESGKNTSFERKGVMNPNNLEQVSIYCFNEKDHGFAGALLYIRDITESRLMERKAIQNEKLASLGFAISCIAHEITNPINAITFNAPILKDYINAMISIVDDHAKDLQGLELYNMPYPQFREDAFRIMANILHASKRIYATVSDLRKFFGNKKPQKRRLIDLKQLIEKTIDATWLEIGQQVKSFQINIPENLPKIYADPVAVEQILTNLLTNAANAADKEDSRLQLDVTQGKTWKEHIIITLSDNGCGMDRETLSKIFTPFFTTKAPGQGMGLGLFISQDLAKDQGGRIEVQSEPGSGSVFRVVLPDVERRVVKRL